MFLRILTTINNIDIQERERERERESKRELSRELDGQICKSTIVMLTHSPMLILTI